MDGKHTEHIPVLLKELLDLLQPKRNQHFVDATFGGGSMAKEILKQTSPYGKLIGIEQDRKAIKGAKVLNNEFSDRLIVREGNFKDIDILVQGTLSRIDGIYFDLGISTDQLNDQSRGISFQNPEARLDMRMAQHDDSFTAAQLLMNADEDDLAALLKNYGDEPRSKLFAKRIVATRKERPFETVADLLAIVKAIYPNTYYMRHPGTKVWQALRIAVNDELASIEEALPKAFDLLADDGRLAVIAFHSLEDRIVKQFIKKLVKEKRAIKVTKKVITPGEKEVRENPRARSAKLRVIKKQKQK
jgi:16S rRNA (cytosine1402-N4)-methyltransferase